MPDIQSLKADLETQLAEARALIASLKNQPSGGLSKSDLKEIVEAAAAPTTVLAKKLKPENAEARKMGPFEHPEGGEKYPKPALKAEVFFGCTDSVKDTKGILRTRVEDLTYFEAVAVNELYDSLGRGQRRICRDGAWRVLVSDTGDQMHLMVPITNPDTRQKLPSFLEIVREFRTGQTQASAADLAATVARLEQQVQELTAAR